MVTSFEDALAKKPEDKTSLAITFLHASLIQRTSTSGEVIEGGKKKKKQQRKKIKFYFLVVYLESPPFTLMSQFYAAYRIASPARPPTENIGELTGLR